jgi:hypothetical protein
MKKIILLPKNFYERFTISSGISEEKKPVFIYPMYIQEYKDSAEERELLKKWGPEYSLKVKSLIWGRYGPQLFQLFDLRDTWLWDKHYEFNKAYYATDEPMHYAPHLIPLEKIC